MNDFWPLVALVLLMQISEENNVLEETGSPPWELLNVRSGEGLSEVTGGACRRGLLCYFLLLLKLAVFVQDYCEKIVVVILQLSSHCWSEPGLL